MAFNFPNNPSVNDEVTFGTITYVWNGTSWESGSSGLSYAEVANRIDYTSDRANSAFELANNSSLWAVRQSFVATANQSTFNISTGYLPNYVDVFYNGIKLYDTEDYTATDGSSVVLTNPAPVNTIIEVLSFGANVSTTNLYVLASATGFSSRQTFTATSGQTTFNPTGGYRVGYIDVYFNGLKMNIPADVTANNGTDVVFVGLTPTTGDTIETVVITPDVSIANAVPITGGTISGNITVAGNILPSSTNTYYLGSESQRWHSLFVNSNSIDIDGLVLSNQNGTLAVSSGGAEPTPIAGEDTWVRDHANAAFAAANNVGPQVEPAFAQANAAFEAANSVNVYGANTAANTFFALPQGLTGDRPASAANGMIRYNTTIGAVETYLYNAGWKSIIKDLYDIEVLVIGGGGGGGGGGYASTRGGGGGAGGYIYYGTEIDVNAASSLYTVFPGNSYTIVVGSGGSGGSGLSTAGSNGTNSSFQSIVALGGGYGGNYSGQKGRDGASGGGGGTGGPVGTAAGISIAGTNPYQGFAGGTAVGYSNSTGTGGGGGGGAKTQGLNGSGGTGGSGGQGFNVAITGASTGYSGGGGGGGGTSGGTSSHGGGEGATLNANGSAGTANRGGGGGGASKDGNPGSTTGGAGGSGVVIIKYSGPLRGTGGTITEGADYTVHTFTGSGTFTA